MGWLFHVEDSGARSNEQSAIIPTPGIAPTVGELLAGVWRVLRAQERLVEGQQLLAHIPQVEMRNG